MAVDRRWAWLALLLLVPVPSLGAVAGLVFEDTIAGKLLWLAGKIWLLVLPMAWLLAVDRGRPRIPRANAPGLVAGAVAGIAVAVLIVAVYLTLGVRWIDADRFRSIVEPLGLASKGPYLVGAAYWILCNSVVEEYVYRWFVYTRAKVLWGWRFATLATAVAFVAHHAILLGTYFDWRVNAVACSGIFLGSVIWSWLYHRHGTIWSAYQCHAIIDVAVFGIGWVLLFG